MSQNAKKFFHLVEKINKFLFRGGWGGGGSNVVEWKIPFIFLNLPLLILYFLFFILLTVVKKFDFIVYRIFPDWSQSRQFAVDSHSPGQNVSSWSTTAQCYFLWQRLRE